MTLEEDAMRNQPVFERGGRSPPEARTWDRFVRGVASVLLVLILTAVFWVPIHFLGELAAAAILAVVAIFVAGLASRLYHLRVRVHALEAVLDDKDRAAAPQTSPVPSEEVEKKP